MRNSLGEAIQAEAQRHGHEEPITSLHSARHGHPCPPPIQPAEHSAEEARRGRGAENGSAQSTEHERAPLPLEEGPGKGSGLAWKLPVTSRHGGSFVGAQPWWRKKTSLAGLTFHRPGQSQGLCFLLVPSPACGFVQRPWPGLRLLAVPTPS